MSLLRKQDMFVAMLALFMAFASPSLPESVQGNTSPKTHEISCKQMQAENHAWKKMLWDGYEISLGPTSQATENPEQGCTGAIYNQAGHVVFRTTGFSVLLDENQTGQDFDGDGKPEVVFKTDTGGGMHCCWAYNVISLSPRPHKLFDIDEPGAVRFEKDSKRKMVIWQLNAGTHEFTSEANTPFAEKVFRVHEGKLVDATPEFCSRIFSEESEDYRAWNRSLTQENIKKLQTTEIPRWENEELISDLLSRALQNVFCRRFDEALNDLNLWPEGTKTKMKADFAESIKQDYPEFAARLISQGQGRASPHLSGKAAALQKSAHKSEPPCQLTELIPGEVRRGEEYDYVLGNSPSLTFHLRVVEAAGWQIEILPREPGPGGERRDWAWPLNPPYHTYNAQNVSVSYDFTVKDVIAYGPREFRFPLNQADAEKALRLYDRLQSATGDQLQEAMNELETFPSGKGTFEILDSRLGTSNAEKQQRGQIDWLKFKVTVTIPCHPHRE